MYDHILTEFPRMNGEDGDSPRIQRAIDATGNGVLCIPKGDYDITETLYIRKRCSLDMHPAARLIAREQMEFVLEYCAEGNYHALTLFNEDGSVYDNLGLFIRGGDIDGNGLASCFAIIDGCYADTAETGYLIYNDARLVNCDFFNNKLMELKQSTAIKHVKGHLVVMSCAFRGTVGTEKLYEGIGEQVDWIANKSTGGEGMREPDFR